MAREKKRRREAVLKVFLEVAGQARSHPTSHNRGCRDDLSVTGKAEASNLGPTV